MAVDDWFFDFYAAHVARHPRDDWPDLESEAGAVFFSGLRRTFVDRGVHDADVAEAASVALMAEKLWKVSDHPPALHKAAVAIYQARGGRHGEAASDRDSAALASRDCAYCSGEGLAAVYASRPDPARRIPESVSAWCVCALGRWVERSHRERSPDVRKRSPDLADALAGRGFWRPDPPWMTAEQGSRNRDPAPHPVPRVVVPPTNTRRWADGLGKLPEFVPEPGKPSPPPPSAAPAAVPTPTEVTR